MDDYQNYTGTAGKDSNLENDLVLLEDEIYKLVYENKTAQLTMDFDAASEAPGEEPEPEPETEY